MTLSEQKDKALKKMKELRILHDSLIMEYGGIPVEPHNVYNFARSMAKAIDRCAHECGFPAPSMGRLNIHSPTLGKNYALLPEKKREAPKPPVRAMPEVSPLKEEQKQALQPTKVTSPRETRASDVIERRASQSIGIRSRGNTDKVRGRKTPEVV